MRISDWSSDVCSSDLEWRARSVEQALGLRLPRHRIAKQADIVVRPVMRSDEGPKRAHLFLPFDLQLAEIEKRSWRRQGLRRRRMAMRQNGLRGFERKFQPVDTECFRHFGSTRHGIRTNGK